MMIAKTMETIWSRLNVVIGQSLQKIWKSHNNENATNKSASMACGKVWLWKLDTKKEWRKTSWLLWDERTEEDTASFMDSEENKSVGPQQSWIREGTIKDCQSKEASILWSHHEEIRELPGKRDNASNNARCTQARKTTHSLDGQDNIKTWTGLTMEESIRMAEDRDKWRKYVDDVANPRIKDVWSTEQERSAVDFPGKPVT